MQRLGATLVIINVVILVVPMAGITIMYRDNLANVIIPPELADLLNRTLAKGQGFGLPVFVGAHYDTATRTAYLNFNLTNPFDYILTVEDLSGEVNCTDHNYPLGHLSLSSPVDLPADETTEITVLCVWTQAAENHFQSEHPGATSINVRIVDLTTNINGVSMTLDEPMDINNVPITA